MLYIIGLTLAFIFGWIMRGERERWKIDDAEPLDLKLTERDMLGLPEKEANSDTEIAMGHPIKDLIFFTYGGLNN